MLDPPTAAIVRSKNINGVMTVQSSAGRCNRLTEPMFKVTNSHIVVPRLWVTSSVDLLTLARLDCTTARSSVVIRYGTSHAGVPPEKSMYHAAPNNTYDNG